MIDILQAWNFSVLSHKELQSLDNLKRLEYFCGFGLLAPTSHNTVPQRFKLNPDKNQIEVFIDRYLVLPESDKHARQAMVSIGAVVANVAVAASTYGFECELTFAATPEQLFLHLEDQQDSERFQKVVTIQMIENKTSNEDLSVLKVMLQRKVVRAEYDRTVTLPPLLINQIEARIAQKYPAIQLHIIQQQLVLRALGKFQEQADRFVMENKLFAKELGDWLLANEDANSERGMRGIEFGLDDEFSKHIHNGLQGNTRLFPDQIAFFARGGKVGVESSSAVFVITSPNDTLEQRVFSGMAYEEIALQLTDAGYSHAVHAALTEVDWVSTMFSTTVLRTRSRPLVLFRVGKPKREIDAKRPHASRPSLSSILL